MKEPHFIVVGDCVVDRYYEGPADRVSPEAPCVVVSVNGYSESPGGAANVAMNLAALKQHVELVTVLGGDDGDPGASVLRDWFQDHPQIKLHAYHYRGYKTPVKTRITAANGQQL